MQRLFISLLLLSFFSPVSLAELRPELQTRSHTLHSKILQQDRELTVYLPSNYHLTTEHITYPVVYLLDGEFLFRPVTGVIEFMTLSSLMPDSIVVGINNVAVAPKATTDVLTEQRIDIVPELFQGEEKAAWGSYLGKQHLAFLTNEVLPFIEQQYRTNSFRTLVGVSPTATFTLYTAWQDVEVFDAYIALNHWSLGLTDKNNKTISDNLISALKATDSKHTYLYLSQNDYLAEDTAITQAEYKQLTHGLRDIPKHALSLKTETIPGYAYNSVLTGFQSALAMMYPRARWEVKYRHFISDVPGQSFANFSQYYSELQQQYGFQVLPKLRKRWATGDDLIALSRRTKDKVQVLEYALSIYGRSADAHTLLADALEQQGKLSKALSLRKKAVDLAIKNNNLRVDIYRQRLRALQQQLGLIR